MSEHPVQRLFSELERFDRYAPGVVGIRKRIGGTSFFPGGWGLWDTRAGEPPPPMPVGGVMILGHDFHSESAFERSYQAGAEDYERGPTWRELLSLLRAVDVPPTACFFTNAYMGLREGSQTTGRFPGSRDPEFVERCRRFFLLQLDAQRPRLILTLGTHVPAFLAPLAPALAVWARDRNLAALDAAGALQLNVLFNGSEAPATVVAAITHPSLRASNVRRRRFGELRGAAAELELLRQACAVSGIHGLPA
jgi:hypothetical protein